ncbi:MAG TPA: hypothetical protein VLH56_10590, partial [Dissulfurispiraceae bacterium]|nr:hypothetical protein [Dissulfurispiraceae bacterium]
GGEGLQAVIEVPAPHAYGRTQGKGGRMINLDAMLKLARAVGAITLALAEGGVACNEVTPQEWKGSRQKCWDRLWAEQQLGRRVRDDEADAIALAHWYTIRARGAR